MPHGRDGAKDSALRAQIPRCRKPILGRFHPGCPVWMSTQYTIKTPPPSLLGPRRAIQQSKGPTITTSADHWQKNLQNRSQKDRGPGKCSLLERALTKCQRRPVSKGPSLLDRPLQSAKWIRKVKVSLYVIANPMTIFQLGIAVTSKKTVLRNSPPSVEI